MEKWAWHYNLLTRSHRQFFFDVLLFLLSSLVTGSSFMSISLLVSELRQLLFTRDLTRNPEIENTPVWILFNIWRLEKRLTDTKFGMNVSLKVTSVEKCQVYSFYRFWVIKGKPAWMMKISPSQPPRLASRLVITI